MTERDAIIEGLRDLADFLSGNPDIPIAKHTFNEFVEPHEFATLKLLADSPRLTFKGSHKYTSFTSDDYMVQRRIFAGGITLDINCERELDDPTDGAISALMVEAGTAGDSEMVRTCTDALRGDPLARRECAKVMDNARIAAQS